MSESTRSKEKLHSEHALLCLIGQKAQALKLLDPLHQLVKIDQKTLVHSLTEKLVDVMFTHEKDFTKQAKTSDHDVAMAILEALRNHDNYFGAYTLLKMLLGEGYGYSPERGKYPISATARNSEHFGVLKTASQKAKLVQDLLKQLIGKEF